MATIHHQPVLHLGILDVPMKSSLGTNLPCTAITVARGASGAAGLSKGARGTAEATQLALLRLSFWAPVGELSIAQLLKTARYEFI